MRIALLPLACSLALSANGAAAATISVNALALAEPDKAASEMAPIHPERISSLADLSDIEAVLGDGSVREIFRSPELRDLFLDKFSLLEISYAAEGSTGPETEIRFFAVENNTSLEKNQRLDRQFEAVKCDGSVRLARLGAGACDGSVTPVPFLATLSIQGTINPSVTVGLNLTDLTLNGASWTWNLTTGITGFEPGAWLGGAFDMTSIFPQQVGRTEFGDLAPVVPPVSPIFNVTVPDTLVSLGVQRDFYFFGLVDVGSGNPFDDALLLRTRTASEGEEPIPQGFNQTLFQTVAAQSFQCLQCSFISAGVGYTSPGRGGVEDPGYAGTRTTASTTFRIYEVPGPAVIPLPAAGWLLLGGLGALAALRRRRADAPHRSVRSAQSSGNSSTSSIRRR